MAPGDEYEAARSLMQLFQFGFLYCHSALDIGTKLQHLLCAVSDRVVSEVTYLNLLERLLIARNRTVIERCYLLLIVRHAQNHRRGCELLEDTTSRGTPEICVATCWCTGMH